MNFLVSVGTAEMERTPATEEFSGRLQGGGQADRQRVGNRNPLLLQR